MLFGAVLMAAFVSAGGNARYSTVGVAGSTGKPVYGYLMIKLVNQPVKGSPIVSFPVKIMVANSKTKIVRYVTGQIYKLTDGHSLKYKAGTKVRLCVVTAKTKKYSVATACPKVKLVKVKAGLNKVAFTVKWAPAPPPPTTTVTTTTGTTSTTTTTTTTTGPHYTEVTLVKHPTSAYWNDPSHYSVICVGANQIPETSPPMSFGILVDGVFHSMFPADHDAYCYPAAWEMLNGTSHTISSAETFGYKVLISSADGSQQTTLGDSASLSFTIRQFPPTTTFIFSFVKM